MPTDRKSRPGASRGVREPRAPAYRSAAMRVNARLDPATAARLDKVVAESGLSITQVLKQAIDLLHDKHKADAAPGRSLAFLESMIGRYSGGPPDLARKHKKYFAQAMEQKHGHHR